MRLQEVEKCKEECESVMRKLAGAVTVVLSVCELCEKHSLGEETRPATLRPVRSSLQRFVSSVTIDSHDLTMDPRSGSDRVSAEEMLLEKGLQRE